MVIQESISAENTNERKCLCKSFGVLFRGTLEAGENRQTDRQIQYGESRFNAVKFCREKSVDKKDRLILVFDIHYKKKYIYIHIYLKRNPVLILRCLRQATRFL